MVSGLATAQNAAEVGALQIDRSEEGVFLSTQLQFDLSPHMEEALSKGIQMIFIEEANLLRERWYWYDKKVVSERRYLRLSYQPYSRRWRLQVANAAGFGPGAGAGLSQYFDSLSDALATIRRLSRWKIAEPGDVDPEGKYRLEFSFSLDVSQLPRLFQLVPGQSEWTLNATRSQRLGPAEAGR